MKSNIKNIISKIYLIFLLSILLNIIYRDQFINEGNLFSKYLIFYFLIFILFLVFLLKENIRTKIIIFQFSIYISFLICDSSLYFYDKLKNKNNDSRTKYQVYKDLKQTKVTTLTVPPLLFLMETEKEIFPIGGISNTLTINCNENGYWSTYMSDRHGFNNPDLVWEEDKDIEYLLIGDSFLHGSCVNENETISSILQDKLQGNTINLGYGSNGLSLYYMTIKEALNYRNIKNIIIFLYLGNDISEEDFESFLNDSFYMQYVNDKNFIQNIFSKQSIVDENLKKKIEDELKILSSNQINIDKTKKNEISKILTLYSFRSFIKKIIRKPQKRPKDNYIYFENTLKKIQSLIMNNQINLHMVLLPDYELLIEKKNYSKTRYERVKKILNKNNIDFLDIYKNTFSKHKKSYKKFFSNKNSHYNSIGYKLVAEDVIIYLSKK